MARTKYKTYNQNLVAKHFPLFNAGVLDKITARNGFTPQEVREYKKKLRAIFIAYLSYKDKDNEHTCHPCYGWVADRDTLLMAFCWGGSTESFNYWNVLDCKLEKVYLRSDIVEPTPTPLSYSVQGKDKAL